MSRDDADKARVLALRDRNRSYVDIVETTGIPRSTVQRWCQERDRERKAARAAARAPVTPPAAQDFPLDDDSEEQEEPDVTMEWLRDNLELVSDDFLLWLLVGVGCQLDRRRVDVDGWFDGGPIRRLSETDNPNPPEAA